MSLNWQAFLQSRPLTNLPKINAEAILTPLPPTAVVRVKGEDAPTFLQGQVTCDVRQLKPYSFSPGAFCNPQGRVIANFWLARDELGFKLLLAADLAEKVILRLKAYVLRSKVEIAVEEAVLFGVTAADPKALQNVLPKPPAYGEVIQAHGLFWLKMPSPTERFLVLGDLAAAQEMWTQLTLEASECFADYWQLQEIRAGLPTVTAATSESFLPQMLNLDRIGGISFAKGCYTGQEIIARTHYRGQVKRRLYRFGLSHPKPLAPGTSLVVGEEPVGQVVNAAPCDLGQELLAVVRCDLSTVELQAKGYHLPLRWLELDYTCYQAP